MSPKPNIEHGSIETSRQHSLWLTAAAAFCTYFCMYAFRKPFAAMTYGETHLYGWDLKTLLVVSQLLGYMLSKFGGIKVVSGIEPRRRAITIIVLIVFAELALVGFAFLPLGVKPLMLFLNGLPLGMVFGLVLGFLEGRRQTEALSAALCASFIASSGVVKSVGKWMVTAQSVNIYHMPMLTGLLFLPGLLLAVWILQRTPQPDLVDIAARRERRPMNALQQRDFLRTYGFGLGLLILIYVVLTILRTIRDDYGAELWREMGFGEQPSIFARSELVVALCVTASAAVMICVHNNRKALRLTIALVGLSFGVTLLAALGKSTGKLSPYLFMVTCGIGLYFPYVAFHTTIFERLIAASHLSCNLGFLMYVADAVGYLCYAVMIIGMTVAGKPVEMLPVFLWLLNFGGIFCLIALVVAHWYFERALVTRVPENAVSSGVQPTADAE